MAKDDARFSDKVKTELSGPGDKPLFPEKEQVSDFETARWLAHVLTQNGFIENKTDYGEPLRLTGRSS